jgi:hypothetical protein
MTPPFTASTNCEAGAPFHGFDAQEHLAELAGAAGLLLVAVMAFGRQGDGFLVGDRGRMGIHVQAELLAHLFQHAAQMGFAQAANDRLMGVGVMIHMQGRVFRHQTVQDVRELVRIGLLLRTHRQAEHRVGEFQRLHVDVIVFGGVVEHRVEGDVVDLRDGADITGAAGLHRNQGFALEAEQMGHLEGFALFADIELGTLADGALMDAEGGDAADIGIDFDLEDMCQHMFGSIRLGKQGLGFLAFALEEEGRIGFAGVGQQLDHDVEESLQAGAGLGGDETDWNQVAVAERFLERRMQLLRRDFPLFQIDVHQVFVHFHDLVHQCPVGFLHAREIRFAGGIEEAVRHPAALSGR